MKAIVDVTSSAVLRLVAIGAGAAAAQMPPRHSTIGSARRLGVEVSCHPSCQPTRLRLSGCSRR